MPENVLESSYLRARRASRVGAACMYALAVVLLAILVLTCLGTRPADAPAAPLVGLLVRNVAAIAATVLLAEFLRKFGSEGSPFGSGQSLRLALAGALLLVHTLFDALFAPTTYAVRLVDAPVPVSVGSWSGIDPMTISLAVFFVCLGMVVRYGRALKEDSDSIV